MSRVTFKALPTSELDALLDEAIASAEKWEGKLGAKGASPAANAFRALKEGKLSLGSPESTLRVIRANDWESKGLTIAESIRGDMQGPEGWNYVVLNLPVLLFPGRGAEYNLVEAALNVQSTRSSARQPAIHAVFPEAKWKAVLEFGGQMELALDGGLNWGAELDQVGLDLGQLGGELAGRVSNKNVLSSFIRVLPFRYELGRAEIEAQWAGGEAMWRIDSAEAIRGNKHVQFVAITKIPQEVERIKVASIAQAEVSFQWLTAQVRNVFEHLSLRMQELLRQRRGIALRDEQTWTLELPQV
jgi:hypothetical protein